MSIDKLFNNGDLRQLNNDALQKMIDDVPRLDGSTAHRRHKAAIREMNRRWWKRQRKGQND
jgi:hypothetical protein